MWGRIPVAWLQLSHGRVKLLLALSGVVFAVLLMWMQLGFLDAMYESATSAPRLMNADLVVISPQSQALFRMTSFPRRLFFRAEAHPGVKSVQAGQVSIANWRNPWTGKERLIFAFGFEPFEVPLSSPGMTEHWDELRETDVCLFDEGSRDEFGPVPQAVRAGHTVDAEVNRRLTRVVGLTHIGASFAVDGNLITSDANFLRLFPERSPGAVDFGLIRLTPDAVLSQVQADLQATFGKEAHVLTRQQFVEFEINYWEKNSPIGFIFTMGTAIGFLVGFVVVYQILHTDVANHLPQYATLKAVGFTDGYLHRLVLKESLILSLLGYLPGTVFAGFLFQFAASATHLPLRMSLNRGWMIFALTVVMCAISASVAVRKLRSADPADVF